uniref:Uncharacterized protein n=1 Tax=Serratia marcescens TaxID=615 RepID=P95798_SERMA|nr:unknown [Serratia marcescens]
MEQKGLPVVPSWRVNTLTELKTHLAAPPFTDSPVCVKPVTGIYGMGFWRFDDSLRLWPSLIIPNIVWSVRNSILQQHQLLSRLNPLF